MINLLFKRNELENLYILGSLVYNLDTSIDFVGEQILSDKSTVHHNITQLNTCFEHLGHTMIKIRTVDNHIIIEGNKSDIYNNVLFDVSCYYILNSPIYNVFKLMSNNSQIDKIKAIESIHISQSYLSKIMARINTFLKPSDIKITSRKGILRYKGPAVNILYLDYLLQRFFLLVQSDVKTNYSQYNINYNFFKTDFEKRKTDLLARTLVSHSKENIIFFTEPSIIQLIQIFYEINDVYDGPVLTSNPEQDRLVINLVTRLSSGQIDDISHRKKIGQSVEHAALNTNNNQILHDILYLTNALLEEYQLLSANRYEIIYLISLKVTAFHIFKCNMEQLLDFTPNFVQTEITTSHYAKTLEELSLNSNVSKLTREMLTVYQRELINDIESIVVPVNDPLKIFISINYQVTRRDYIIKRIQSLFSNDSISIVHSLKEADMLVCDYLFPKETHQSFFLLADPSSQHAVELLLNFITEKYIEKQRPNL